MRDLVAGVADELTLELVRFFRAAPGVFSRQIALPQPPATKIAKFKIIIASKICFSAAAFRASIIRFRKDSVVDFISEKSCEISIRPFEIVPKITALKISEIPQIIKINCQLKFRRAKNISVELQIFGEFFEIILHRFCIPARERF